MTDALHRCVRCEVADENVTVPHYHLTPEGHASIPRSDFIGFAHEHGEIGCCAALKRQLAAANALIDRCRPYFQERVDELGELVEAGWEDAELHELYQEYSALLADIDAALK